MRTSALFEVVESMVPVDHRQADLEALDNQIDSVEANEGSVENFCLFDYRARVKSSQTVVSEFGLD